MGLEVGSWVTGRRVGFDVGSWVIGLRVGELVVRAVVGSSVIGGFEIGDNVTGALVTGDGTGAVVDGEIVGGDVIGAVVGRAMTGAAVGIDRGSELGLFVISTIVGTLEGILTGTTDCSVLVVVSDVGSAERLNGDNDGSSDGVRIGFSVLTGDFVVTLIGCGVFLTIGALLGREVGLKTGVWAGFYNKKKQTLNVRYEENLQITNKAALHLLKSAHL